MFKNEIKIQKTNKETGCTQSLYGVKGKCVLNIVPKNIPPNAVTLLTSQFPMS